MHHHCIQKQHARTHIHTRTHEETTLQTAKTTWQSNTACMMHGVQCACVPLTNSSCKTCRVTKRGKNALQWMSNAYPNSTLWSTWCAIGSALSTKFDTALLGIGKTATTRHKSRTTKQKKRKKKRIGSNGVTCSMQRVCERKKKQVGKKTSNKQQMSASQHKSLFDGGQRTRESQQ